jgi:hypothetical protein
LKFHRVGQYYNLCHDGDSLLVGADMTTLPMTQNQIADFSCGPLPLDCSRTKHRQGTCLMLHAVRSALERLLRSAFRGV